MIEGTQGITIDSSSANIELKGNQISLKATPASPSTAAAVPST